MKILLKLLALALGVLLASPCFAINKEITSVSATPSTILTPSNSCTMIVIQNNGSGVVRLGLDGGTTNKAKSTPDPTASTGYKLAAGAFLIITLPPNTGGPNIRAILESGTTTTLSVITNDPFST